MRAVAFCNASVDAIPLEAGSLDFCYSLGVLHHIPDTVAAICDCVKLLKPGAPLLLYLYYALENRAAWYRALWRMSDIGRRCMRWLPPPAKYWVCDAVALGVYMPLAQLSRLVEWSGLDASQMPLASYRDKSFRTMRTDALDRSGTHLEKRFSGDEIRSMMVSAGLENVELGGPPYWCAIGYRPSQ